VIDSDETLYARAKTGDLRAFDELYARYERKIFGFVLSILRVRADAEDAFHECFVSAMRAPTVRFDRSGAFVPGFIASPETRRSRGSARRHVAVAQSSRSRSPSARRSPTTSSQTTSAKPR